MEGPPTDTNSQSGTNVHEIADGICRINTPVRIPGAGGFSVEQYLIKDDQPLLFHTGPRKMFPLLREAAASVLPTRELRYIAFSYVESEECGSLNEWLGAALQAVPLCGTVAAMVSITDLADRAPRAIADGERLSLGERSVPWFDTPHLPHAWDCGPLTEESTSTLLCSDLFKQGGADLPPVTDVGHPCAQRSFSPRNGQFFTHFAVERGGKGTGAGQGGARPRRDIEAMAQGSRWGGFGPPLRM